MSLDAPIARKLTYADYVLIPDDGQRREIVDGVPIANPAPSVSHQQVSVRLLEQLLPQVVSTGIGHVFHAPLDVELTPHDIVQPDVLVVLAHHADRIRSDRVVGPPDLVVEILSPSSVRFDRTQKKDRYALAGVPEYWIIDPASCAIEAFVLVDGTYQRQPEASPLRLARDPRVELDVARLW